MNKTTVYLLGAVILLLLAHYVFFADEWSALFSEIAATITDFFAWLKWVFVSFVMYYAIMWGLNKKFPKFAQFVMGIVCYVIAVVSPKLSSLMYSPFEDEEDKKKREEEEKKKEAEAKKKAAEDKRINDLAETRRVTEELKEATRAFNEARNNR